MLAFCIVKCDHSVHWLTNHRMLVFGTCTVIQRKIQRLDFLPQAYI